MRAVINIRPSIFALGLPRSLIQLLNVDLLKTGNPSAYQLLYPLTEISPDHSSKSSLTDKIEIDDQLRYFLKYRVERLLRQIAIQISKICSDLNLTIMHSAGLDQGSQIFLESLSKALCREILIRPSELCQEAYTRPSSDAERTLEAIATFKGSLASSAADTLMDAARRQIRFGDAWTAERMLERVVVEHPRRQQAWSLLGLCANMMGDTIRAERFFDIWKQTGTEDDLVRANYVIAMLYLRHHPAYLRSNDRAEKLLAEAYENLLQRKERDRKVEIQTIFNRNGHALIEFRKGDIDKAITILSTGISELNGNSDDIEKMHKSVLMYNLAQCFRAKGDILKSIEIYNRVIELDKYYPEYRIDLAHLYIEIEQFSEACIQINTAKDLDESILELDNLAGIYNNHFGDLAPELFSVSYRFAPDNPTYAYNRSLLLAEKGLYLEALWAIQNADLQQATPDLITNLASLEAEAWASLEKWDEARHAINRAADIVGSNEQLVNNMNIINNSVYSIKSP